VRRLGKARYEIEESERESWVNVWAEGTSRAGRAVGPSIGIDILISD
jgi:hypothetical protein